MTTVDELLEKAMALSPEERKLLVKLLIGSLDNGEAVSQAKTGSEIVAMLEAMDPIEFVDDHIDDPVQWVKEQRHKDAEPRDAYRCDDSD